jgi:hypothetical protein
VPPGAETVQRFGGFLAKYMGDGVLVYFGYPQAHEDDAQRAVGAGLELVAAVSALSRRLRLYKPARDYRLFRPGRYDVCYVERIVQQLRRGPVKG